MTRITVLGSPSSYDKPYFNAVEWLTQPRRDPERNTLTILRKFSSTLPRVPLNEEEDLARQSFGGGYFLQWGGYGLVIDPGFNFIENFGKYTHLTVANIDGVLLTHAHSDHTHDFEPLVDLVYERNRQGILADGDDYARKRIDVYLNPTAYGKFAGMLSRVKCEKSDDCPVEGVTELDRKKPIELSNYLNQHVLTVYPQKAEHKDNYGSDCMGVKVELLDPLNPSDVRWTIGITSDSGWFDGMVKAYSGVDLLIPHVGFIRPSHIEAAKNGDAAKLESMVGEKDWGNTHLGLPGAFWLVKEVGPTLAILSEFNYQAGDTDLRLFAADAVEELSGRYEEGGWNGPRCLAGTLGLSVELGDTMKIKCDSLNDYVVPWEYQQTADNAHRRITCCCDAHSSARRV